MTNRKKRIIIKLLAYGFIISWAVFSLFPLSTMFLTALKPKNAFDQFPPSYFSTNLTLDNFKYVLFNSDWIKYYLDTIFISTAASIIAVLTGSLGAYAFSRYQFKYKRTIMVAILALQMIPVASIVIPLYNMFATINMLDTYWVLILINAVGSMPLIIWLMNGYFSSIPKELEEAAYIDGCSNMKAFWKVTFPLAAPGLAASMIYAFVYAFGDYIIAKTLAGSRIITYTVGLTLFSNQYEGMDITLVSAAAFTALVPIIVLFSIFHKYFIIGMTGGALKE
ncbi:MAG: hypothetical protein DRP32_07050 [Thermotogae bacterium]|uniref:carbohydrate ABC transporter permease n=1 Tax=Kosmotoga sp. TaxID=1955248 RepID=UPI000F1719CB|nr:carbohydrate ABC transporter permease [Kosmotoga sp.]MBO8167299.1 carbohydrate ABC transporter permease [Kosmotoga sp.]MCD6160317.1 carbohydrate ABC transporter permease [Kosmotoga sp.]RKX48493.1 MAG: hypothetical protein DRP32_07050 [Thermotogota bacterium]